MDTNLPDPSEWDMQTAREVYQHIVPEPCECGDTCISVHEDCITAIAHALTYARQEERERCAEQAAEYVFAFLRDNVDCRREEANEAATELANLLRRAGEERGA